MAFCTYKVHAHVCLSCLQRKAHKSNYLTILRLQRLHSLALPISRSICLSCIIVLAAGDRSAFWWGHSIFYMEKPLRLSNIQSNQLWSLRRTSCILKRNFFFFIWFYFFAKKFCGPSPEKERESFTLLGQRKWIYMIQSDFEENICEKDTFQGSKNSN